MVYLSMRFSLIIATCFIAAVKALILLEDIDYMTGTTWAAIEWMISPIVADTPRPPQHLLTPLEDIEKTIYAMNQLHKGLAKRLSVPMRVIEIPEGICPNVGRSYDDFLTQTTRLLALLMERKPNPFSASDGSTFDHQIFHEIEWMQKLWASRTAPGNNQNLSFIEQRQTLYKATGCFPNMKEVLRRDVEVVELLNDVLDAYRPEDE